MSQHYKTSALILLAIILSVIISVFISVKLQPKFVTVDVGSIIDRQIKKAKTLSKEQAKTRGEHFGAALSESIEDFAWSTNSVILLKKAVVSDLPDMTIEIEVLSENRLRRMKN